MKVRVSCEVWLVRWKGRRRWAGVSLFPSPTATFLLPTLTDAWEGRGGRGDATQGCKVARWQGRNRLRTVIKNQPKRGARRGMRLAQIVYGSCAASPFSGIDRRNSFFWLASVCLLLSSEASLPRVLHYRSLLTSPHCSYIVPPE